MKRRISTHIHSPHSHRHAKQLHLLIYLFILPSFTCWKRSLGNIRAFTKLLIQTFCGCARTSLLTIAFCFPPHRATAFGILNGLCKFGAILGNSIFSSFVGITKVVPILLASSALVGGGLLALRLPETREQVLM